MGTHMLEGIFESVFERTIANWEKGSSSNMVSCRFECSNGCFAPFASSFLKVSFNVDMQAAKIIANLLVAGGTVLFRAATQAYKQAIISTSSSGLSCFWSAHIRLRALFSSTE